MDEHPIRRKRRAIHELDDVLDAPVQPGVVVLGIEQDGQPLAAAQAGSVLAGERGPDLAAVVDTLANRFGGRRLYRAEPRESVMPERGVGAVPALSPAAGIG